MEPLPEIGVRIGPQRKPHVVVAFGREDLDRAGIELLGNLDGHGIDLNRAAKRQPEAIVASCLRDTPNRAYLSVHAGAPSAPLRATTRAGRTIA